MRLRAKVVTATQQQPMTAWASTSITGAHPYAMLFKFAMSEDHQIAFWRRKGLARTKLSLDEDLTPVQHAHKSELWLLFKEAKAANKRTF